MDPVARAEFPDLLIEFGEGDTDWPYPDNAGNITIGRGNMLPNQSAFMWLDWRNPDGAVASSTQLQTAWLTLQSAAARVRSLGPKKWPGGGYYETLTSIRASRASIDALIQARLDENDRILRAQWPGWDAAKPNAQKALMRLAWALGPEFARRWPRLHQAWVAQEWHICAQECRIPSLDQTEPGDPAHGIPSANDIEAGLFESCVEDTVAQPAS